MSNSLWASHNSFHLIDGRLRFSQVWEVVHAAPIWLHILYHNIVDLNIINFLFTTFSTQVAEVAPDGSMIETEFVFYHKLFWGAVF